MLSRKKCGSNKFLGLKNFLVWIKFFNSIKILCPINFWVWKKFLVWKRSEKKCIRKYSGLEKIQGLKTFLVQKYFVRKNLSQRNFWVLKNFRSEKNLCQKIISVWKYFESELFFFIPRSYQAEHFWPKVL